MTDSESPEGAESSKQQESEEDALLSTLSEVCGENAELMFGLFSGPLPPPSVLRKYDEIVPGMARDMHDLALKKAHHELEWERRSLEASIEDRMAERRQFKVGQVLAFLLSLTLIFAGSACVLLGHDTAGATIISGTLASLVLAFLYGNRSNPSQAENDSKRFSKPPTPE